MPSKLFFHCVTGPSIKLSEDKLSACRKQPAKEFDNGWVFSEKCLNSNSEFQIQILHLIPTYHQSLKFGITLENPDELLKLGLLSQNEIFKNTWMLQNDKFYYQNDDSIITTEEYEVNLSSLQEGDLVGLKITEKGELYFTHNGIPFRTIAEDVPPNVWVFVNLYGKCSFVTIIPPDSAITRSQKEKMISKLTQFKEGITASEEGEMHFHSNCGKEVRLHNNNRVAQRKNPTNEFRNAVVISSRPLIINTVFRLRIEGIINKWNGSIEFGVTIHNPDSFELPATMTNLRSGTLVLSGNSILTNGHGNQLPYSTLNLDDLKIGDEIGVMRNGNGDIHFIINQKDLGVAGNISVDIDIWVIIDLYGRTIKVSIPNSCRKSPLLNMEGDLNLQPDSIDNMLLFHPICGRNVIISQDGCNASRINDQEFNNGVVFTNRPLRVGERWTVKLVRCVQQWAGNLEIGITSMVPSDLDFPSTMTDLNIGYTVMLTSNGLVINGCPLSQSDQTLDLENVHSVLLTGIPSLLEDCTLGVELTSRDKVQFFMNNADLGSITLKTIEEIYGVIDLYGKAAEVSVFLRKTHGTASVVNDTVSAVSANKTEPFTSGYMPCGDRPIFPILSESDQPIFDNPFDLCMFDESYLRIRDFLSPVSIPDITFHHIHGRNVILSNQDKTAYRPSPNNEFKNALVMSSRPLFTNELFEICIEKMTDHWSGSLEMGVTLIKPEDLNFPGTLSQLDKDCWILSGSCLMNNGITVRNDYSLDMDHIHVNSKIGIVHRMNGMLHFFLDGLDMGFAYFDVPEDIYVILDLYGQCSQVSITSRTGEMISNDKFNININPTCELSNTASRRDQEESFSLLSDGMKPQCTSSLERTMSAIKKSLSSTSEYFSSSKSIKIGKSIKSKVDEGKQFSVAEENNFCINNLFSDFIAGQGITVDNCKKFFTHNQNSNCMIQFKQPLKTNYYYELLFWNDKSHMYNLEPISFGMISDKINLERYLPDNLSLVKSSSWIVSGGRLFINNTLRCQSFAPTLTRYKNRILVGLYFYDNSNLEIYVDSVSVGKVISEIHEECYLLVNLRGWFNTLICLGMSSKPIDCLSQSFITTHLPDLSSGDQKNFSNDNSSGNIATNQQKNMNFDDSANIEDPLIISIIDELSILLPFFLLIIHGIDSKKLTEKVVTRNNDIVLCVRKTLLTKFILPLSDNFDFLREEIQNELIEELSNRFSCLSELSTLGDSRFEIARFLRRRITWDKTAYDEKKIVFTIPNSCLTLKENRIIRMKSGNDFGLCILNQELKSKKIGSYEIQFVHSELSNNLASKNEFSSSVIGLILIENSHFPNTEDVFRFLLSTSCPRHINFLSNYLNKHLELQKFELKAATIMVEEDCIYFNGEKICKRMPFNIKTISQEDHLSFMVVDNELEMADIYLSVRNKDSVSNFKIFSQNWWKSSDRIKTIHTTRNIYYYVPFVWLKDQSEAVIVTEQKVTSLAINEISQTNQQDWLEKHYNDGLNKESNHSETISTDIVNRKDRQCISLSRSVAIKSSLTLPDTHFYSKLVDCFCSNCFNPTNGISAEQNKDFRLPFGWVKYNTRFNKDDKSNLSAWKTAYLTASSGLLHRLLTSTNPIHVLKNFDNCNSSQIAWLKCSTNASNQLVNKSIVVSPWQPLIGYFVNEDDSINQCNDGIVEYFDPLSNTQAKAKIALEVRVKPNTFKILECRIVTENQMEIKRIIPKEIDEYGNKKLVECGTLRPINQKTVWVLNGDENSIIISGLLMKI